MNTILATLFFPTMNPIFQDRLLTPAEQADLLAFFQQASSRPPPVGITPALALLAVIGFLVLLAITALLWRGRLRHLRRDMVAAATRDREVRS